MISSLAYTLIFGKPVIMYGGILTFLSLIFTTSIAMLNRRGIQIVPFKWHPRAAVATIVLATLHAILGLAAYLGF